MTSAEESPHKSRRWRHRALMVFGALFIVLVLIAAEAARRESRRQQLSEEIRIAGGYAERQKSLLESFQMWRRTGKFPPRRSYVHLKRSTFNNDWIRNHDYLRDFDIRLLECIAITGDDLAALIDAHPLEALSALNAPLTDEVLRAIRDNRTLNSLAFGDTRFTDEQLGKLPLERLKWLSIGHVGVTPAGALQASRCRELTSIDPNAAQLTDELADILASLGTVRDVHLFDPETTDDHLRRLHRIKTLKSVYIDSSGVTEEGRAALAEALPGLRIELPETTNETSLPEKTAPSVPEKS